MTLKQLDKARSYGHDPVTLIENAVANNWTGCVFADKHFQPITPDPSNRPPTTPLLSKAGEQQRRNLEAWLQQDAIEVAAHEIH